MATPYSGSHDVPDLSVPLPAEIMDLLEKSKTVRTKVLPGTERPNRVGLYAETFVNFELDSDENVLNCIKLLYWSDERLSKIPDLLAMWDWQQTSVEARKVYFSTGWYDKAFFEARNAAFLGRSHESYFSMFGISASDLTVTHEIK